MSELAVAVFLASVVGSLHCAGMCGGFLTVATADGASTGRGGALRAQLAFSAGRLVAYSILGAGAGSLGATLDVLGDRAGLARSGAIVAATVVLVLGAMALLVALGARMPRVAPPRVMRLAVARGLALAPRSAGGRGFAIGLLAACLPCGWLYSFVLTAAITGSAAGGTLVMGVFWLGTLPALAVLALGVGAIAPSLRRRLPIASAIAMILIGLVALTGRAGLGLRHPHPANAIDATAHAVSAPASATAAASQATAAAAHVVAPAPPRATTPTPAHATPALAPAHGNH